MQAAPKFNTAPERQAHKILALIACWLACVPAQAEAPTSCSLRSGQAPKWNFHQALISRSGEQVISHGSAVDPKDPLLLKDL